MDKFVFVKMNILFTFHTIQNANVYLDINMINRNINVLLIQIKKICMQTIKIFI
jgi:hypothetical protein